MPAPTVRVIGYTKFLGAPPELMPSDPTLVAQKNQLQGSEPAMLIEVAGRTCYDSLGNGRASIDYHAHIKEVGHGSVCEHAVINFFISGVSRGLTHELVRHRAGCAISQRSTRYVDESSSPWILHPLLEKYIKESDNPPRHPNGEVLEPHIRTRTVNAINTAKKAYDAVVTALQDELIKAGADKFTARKQARGAARGLLGNALQTELVWSANIRALRGVIEQRASPHADAEIRVLANRLYEEAMKVCPEYFDDYRKVDCPDGIGYGLVTNHRKI